MEHSTFTVTASDGTSLHVNRWLPAGSPTAAVQITHGMAEHSERYARFAEALTGEGYAVYAADHRGHKGTAGTHDDEGYFADENGFDTVVDDLAEVTAAVRSEQPGLPVVLVGHSMGSFIARAYAARHAGATDGHDALTGLVLSGTAGDAGLLGRVGAGIASLQSRLRGRRHSSGLMDKLSFGQYNAAFKPTRTDFDWLSRDPDEVDKYVADEWCGNVFTAGFYADLLPGLHRINTDALVASVPKDLPILLVAGDKDPVGANGKGPTAVAEQYRRAGVRDVELILYPEARHEVLNETNRDEVTADIIGWIGRVVGAARGASA